MVTLHGKNIEWTNVLLPFCNKFLYLYGHFDRGTLIAGRIIPKYPTGHSMQVSAVWTPFAFDTLLSTDVCEFPLFLFSSQILLLMPWLYMPCYFSKFYNKGFFYSPCKMLLEYGCTGMNGPLCVCKGIMSSGPIKMVKSPETGFTKGTVVGKQDKIDFTLTIWPL